MSFSKVAGSHDEFHVLRGQVAALLSNGKRPASLWIACDDPSLDGPLEMVRRRMPILLLRRPGACVLADGLERNQELSAINYAVERLHVPEIVVCGHSLCSSIPSGCDPESVNDVDGDWSFVRRALDREQHNSRARRHLVAQLELLATYPSVRASMFRQELRTLGLFYLVESGVFSLYQPSKGTFVPYRGDENGRASRDLPSRSIEEELA